MNIAVIFAGGVGKRMHSKDLPKQFLHLHGYPVLVRTVSIFEECKLIDKVVIACHPEWIDFCSELVDQYHLSKVASIVPGGSTGQESIYRGLVAAKHIAFQSKSQDRDVVLIHDGVRPLIDEATIQENIESVKEYGSAITCVPVTETIALTDENDNISDIHPRESLRIARAPQSFWLDEIYSAHNMALKDGRSDFIDSACLMFYYGFKLHLIKGPIENIKVTTPGDFFAVQAVLNARENEQIYSS